MTNSSATSDSRSSVIGPVALGLFVNAGSLKSHPLLAWLPLDLTFALAILLALVSMATALRSSFIPKAIGVPVLLAVSTLPGVALMSTGYGESKSSYFYTLTLLGMCAAVFLLDTPRRRNAFLITLGAIGAVVAILVFVSPARPAEWSAVVMLPGTNTIATSRMILAGVIAVALYSMIGNRNLATRIGLFVLAGFMIITALNTGSRGPAIAAAAGVAVALLVTPAFGRRRLRSITLLAGVATGGVLLAAQGGAGGITRIVTFLEGETDTSAGARGTFWDVAVSHATNLPLGGGWGYFGKAFAGDGATATTATYPHNSIIEITLEAGWAAGLTFIILASMAITRYVKVSGTAQSATFLVLFVFTLLNSLVSGDVNDNRLMWVLLVAAWVISARTPNAETPPPETRVGAFQESLDKTSSL
ncbi:O-antigen ligase family protein [Microbacterium sp. LWH12-1.2]|uniref:O-antigen ligase family protein n=1 Tax=Microbacterium sp. LWH12-1.2 TaxID=3135259 RepID=UPI003444C6BA